MNDYFSSKEECMKAEKIYKNTNSDYSKST